MASDWPCVHWLAKDGATRRWLPDGDEPETLAQAPLEKIAHLRSKYCAWSECGTVFATASSGVYRVYFGDASPWEKRCNSWSTLLHVSRRTVLILDRHVDSQDFIVTALNAVDGSYRATVNISKLLDHTFNMIDFVGIGGGGERLAVAAAGILIVCDMAGEIVWRVQDQSWAAGRLLIGASAADGLYAHLKRENVVRYYSADGRPSTIKLPDDAKIRTILGVRHAAVLMGVENGFGQLRSIEVCADGCAIAATKLPFTVTEWICVTAPGYIRDKGVVLIICNQQCAILVSPMAEVLKIYPLTDDHVAAWWPTLESCATREYDRALAAIAAIDELRDGDTEPHAVGLVWAVLDGFVAEDARLTLLQQQEGDATF